MKFLIYLIGFLGNILSWMQRRKDIQEGRNEQSISDLTTEVNVEKELHKASVESPKDVNSLIELLRKGKAVILIFLSFTVISCTSSTPVVINACPQPQTWTKDQQNQIADSLSQIKSDSILIPVVLEWERLRSESRACLGH